MFRIWKSLSWAYCADCEAGIGRDRPDEKVYWDEKIFGKIPNYAVPYFCERCAKKRGLA